MCAFSVLVYFRKLFAHRLILIIFGYYNYYMNKKNSSEPAKEVCRLLNACAEKMRRFVAHKDNHRLYGLSVGQIEILRFLAEAEGDIMLKDLIKTFKISKSLASQSVARLVRHGFICKSRSTCDSRNIILSKTKKLELLESKIRQIEIDYFFKAIGNLPREDSIALANLLRSLQINLEKELV